MQCDCELPPLPIYKGMSVIITKNSDKKNGVMNGQKAWVDFVHNKTVFLKLPNGSTVSTYMVTSTTPDGGVTTAYPFVPAYALTICKSQGQTLQIVII